MGARSGSRSSSMLVRRRPSRSPGAKASSGESRRSPAKPFTSSTRTSEAMRSRVARRGLVAAAALGLLLGSGSAFAADEAKPDSAAAEPQNEETGKLDQAVKAIEQLNYTEAQQL